MLEARRVSKCQNFLNELRKQEGKKANINEKFHILLSLELDSNVRVTVTRISKTKYPCDDSASQHMFHIKVNPPILYAG